MTAKILVVEDEPAIQELLGFNVRQAGFQVLRAEDADSMWDQLRSHLPDLILRRQTITPLDLELGYGLPEGDIFHGQMAIDQLLFMRPIPGYGRFRSPVEGLYFCGAGAHPGGGLSGAPGRNAAREVLKDL